MPVFINKKSLSQLLGEELGNATISDKLMAFLVHLEVNKMAATVYTTEEFANDKKHDKDDESVHSDEMSDGGNEFSAVPVAEVDTTVNS